MRRSRSAAANAVVGLAVVFGIAVVAACGSETSEDTANGDPNGGDGGPSSFGDGGNVTGNLDGNVYAPGDGAPGTCVPLVLADGTTPQCSDCKDNDGDGKIDWQDPECAGPLDNDEATFGTGIPGDNQDACKQDCFFDGNSGQGDDGCDWNLKCDPANTSPGTCAYDPNYKNCPPQTQKCIDNCQKLTPNGCDCFGCCAVTTTSGTKMVRLSSTCSLADINDPTKCAPCTQTPSCLNPCDTCELCIGKTTLPPECAQNAPPDAGSTGGQTCSGGLQVCNDATPCPSGTYCVTGCCITVVR